MMPALVEKPIKKRWHQGRQKLIYILIKTKHMSPL